LNDSVYNVLKRPLITERTNELRDAHNQYAFEVNIEANKVQIRHAIEDLFGVRVTAVRTVTIAGKVKRFRRGFGKRPNWKKAIVTLRDGDMIDIFEGV
jgi:large subunit ribosomal protein L23